MAESGRDAEPFARASADIACQASMEGVIGRSGGVRNYADGGTMRRAYHGNSDDGYVALRIPGGGKIAPSFRVAFVGTREGLYIVQGLLEDHVGGRNAGTFGLSSNGTCSFAPAMTLRGGFFA